MIPIRSLVVVLTLLVTACVPVYKQHGYVPPEQDLAQIVVGQTSRDQLAELIGRPTSQGLLEGGGWYYVGSRWRNYGALRPQEVSREVVAISFAPGGTVANVERFGLRDGRVVTLSRRVTDTGVQSVSAIRQILGNVGNFNAASVLE